jgi:hypothetical protein
MIDALRPAVDAWKAGVCVFFLFLLLFFLFFFLSCFRFAIDTLGLTPAADAWKAGVRV